MLTLQLPHGCELPVKQSLRLCVQCDIERVELPPSTAAAIPAAALATSTAESTAHRCFFCPTARQQNNRAK